MMTVRASLFLIVAVLSCLCAADPAGDAPRDLGSDTALALQQRYDSRATECSSTTPAILCSGVLLRATGSREGNAPWNPILPNNYGVSFSFLRQDANFTALAGGAVNGFIFYPALQQPTSKATIEVLCMFPVGAGSEDRVEAGCGQHKNYPQASDICHRQNITEASAWLAHYMAPGLPEQQRDWHQCGFSLRSSDRPYTVANFNAALLARRLLATTRFNEVRVATWEKDIADVLPLEAFFYLQDSSTGLTQARHDQQAFKLASGGMVKPVIRLTMPTNINGRALFTYLPSDQAETPVPDPAPAPYPRQVTRQCPSYISEAVWINRNDGISLAVTPTACARNNIPAAEREFGVGELFEKWASDPRFTNPGGMRDQYVCHMKNAPSEQQWNLEPWRPYVGAANTEAAYCNPK